MNLVFRKRIIIFVLTLFFFGCATSPEKTENIQTKLVGIWKGEQFLSDKNELRKWTQIRKEDGTYELRFKVYENGTIVDTFLAKGKWWVEGDLFHEFSNDTMKEPDVYKIEFINEDKLKFSQVSSDVSSNLKDTNYTFIENRVSKSKSIELNFFQQPNRETRIITSSTTELINNIEGSKEIIEINRKRGVTFPYKVTQSKTTKMRIKTGPLEPGGSFSYEQYIEDVASFAEDKNEMRIKLRDPMEDLVGLTIYGRIKDDNQWEVDFIDGKDLDYNTRTMAENTIKAMARALIAPNEILSVGDHYDMNATFDMPMPGLNPIKISSNSRFTLNKIKNGKAYFNVSTTFSIPKQAEEITLKADGSGKGQMIYNIENRIQEKYTTDMSMNMEVTMGEIVTSSSIKALSTMQTIVVDN